MIQLTPQKPPYYTQAKIYSAILNQTGANAPVATNVINTIGEITWTRDSQGIYNITCAETLTNNKIYFYHGMTQNQDRPQIAIIRLGPSTFQMYTYSNGAFINDDILLEMPFTIILKQ